MNQGSINADANQKSIPGKLVLFSEKASFWLRCHMYCEVIVYKNHQVRDKPERDTLVGIHDDQLVFLKKNNKYPIELIKPVLYPLLSMTPEQAIELCKLSSSILFGDYRFSKWEATLDEKTDKNWGAYNVSNKGTDHSFVVDLGTGEVWSHQNRVEDGGGGIIMSMHDFYYWQWYFLNHFDIPMMPDGKTLIDQGYAIDITSEWYASRYKKN